MWMERGRDSKMAVSPSTARAAGVDALQECADGIDGAQVDVRNDGGGGGARARGGGQGRKRGDTKHHVLGPRRPGERGGECSRTRYSAVVAGWSWRGNNDASEVPV